MRKKFVALETPQSSICNLDCVYCYIPKNKVLKEIHKKWRSRYSNGIYQELLSTYYDRNQVTNISLWGAEPSLGFKDLKNIKELLYFFPKLENISTSSNFTIITGFEELFSNLDKYLKEVDKKIRFDLQISIDGPKDITNKNRGIGTYELITMNLDLLRDLTAKYNNINYTVHTKSTNVASDFRDFVKDPKKLENYVKSFIELDNKYVKSKNWPENVNIDLRSLPTLALPGSYTKEDGLNFYKYHILIDKLKEKEEYKDYLRFDQYEARFREMLSDAGTMNKFNANEHFLCSAGTSMISLDPDGTVHGCHGSFWYNYDEYLESSDELADWTEGRRIIDFDASKFWELTKPIIAYYRDDYNYSRLRYVLSSYAGNMRGKLSIVYGTIKTLAAVGQISKIYYDNDDYAKLFAYFIVLKSLCWINSFYLTGSLYPVPLSIYRIYGNGVFERALEETARGVK